MIMGIEIAAPEFLDEEDRRIANVPKTCVVAAACSWIMDARIAEIFGE